MTASLVERFRSARHDPSLAVLEGFHALKHAMRVGADINAAVTHDLTRLDHLLQSLAPDLAERMRAQVTQVSADVFERLAPVPHETGVLAIAKRRVTSREALDALPQNRPIVLLEEPSH